MSHEPSGLIPTCYYNFLADRTNGRAYATVLRLSVCLYVRLSVRRL